MRRFVMFASGLLLVASLTALPRLARSALRAEGAAKPEVRVSLAVPEGYNTLKSPLHVIIENVSSAPQQHFEEWNSWGYGNLTVAWTAADGTTGTVKKVPGVFTRNIPTAITLQPGQSLVREIHFDAKLWEGWPAIARFDKLTLQVTYEVKSDPKAPAWSGKVTSEEQTILIR
jgi:hypothetical protein